MNENDNEFVVYELGYHLTPSIAEGDIPGEVSKIKALIEGNAGSIIAEEAPKLLNLAYPIGKSDRAYFGWVKFETAGENIAKLNAAMQAETQVLRFLIIKTEKENTIHFHKISSMKIDDSVEPDPEVKKNTVEDIDKSIEELVI